jgi:peptide/nickel transport system substrate-binding protein
MGEIRASVAGCIGLTLLAMLIGCAGQAPANLDRQAAPGQPAAPKVLTIGIQSEPPPFTGFAGGGGTGSAAGGAANAQHIADDSLVAEHEIDAFRPVLAVELPSIDDGTWRVNSDGSMDVTWKIRPNVRWHDGVPFTSADLLFTYSVLKDPDTPAGGVGRRLQESVSAPDPLTYVVHWSQTYVDVVKESGGHVIPKHLLEEPYGQDKTAFFNSSRFTTDFVGTGPYKLDEWAQGSYIKFVRFDDYYRGRPPLDTVYLRFIGDPNAMVANVMANAVDVLLPLGGVDLETAMEMKQRWDREGGAYTVTPGIAGALRLLEIQYRPDIARPRNGLATNVPLRQGLYNAIDRQTLVDVVTVGLAPVADSYYEPNHEIRSQLDIPKYPYVLSRAQQLLAQAGWTRGPDGILVHQQTGDRLELEIWGRNEGKIEKEQNIIGDGWKAVGAQVVYNVIPTSLLADREYQSSYPGVLISEPGGDRFYKDRLNSSIIPSAANRWAGENRGGYSDPRVDTLLSRLNLTIDERERLPLLRDLLQVQMGEVVTMPLYWTTVPVIQLKSVRAQPFVRNNATWNFFEWDRD